MSSAEYNQDARRKRLEQLKAAKSKREAEKIEVEKKILSGGNNTAQAPKPTTKFHDNILEKIINEDEGFLD